MELEEIKKDYEKYKSYYEQLQQEVYDFLSKFKEQRKESIDIYEVSQRPNNKIKEFDSIIKNIGENPKKYKKISKLIEIKDIAGDRITCHCRSDREAIRDILFGELKKQFIDVMAEEKNEGPYRAYHFNFAKEFDIDGNKEKLYCEIQSRTILGNAWAIQDTKYLYKKGKEGEPQVLSMAVSDILYGCEGLWDLVKMKSKEETKGLVEEILKIKTITAEKFETIEKEIREESNNWFDKNIEKAFAHLHAFDIDIFMEIKMYLPMSNLNISKRELRDAAINSQIHTFGWPIAPGVRDGEYSPKPNDDGIVTEIATKEDKSFDYWSIKQDGSFYLLKSIFEEKRKPNYLFFDTRTIRITETLMYARNLYSNLKLGKEELITIIIKHGGLKGKIMGATGNRLITSEYKSVENQISTTIVTTIKEIEENTTNLVLKFTTPLFELFDFLSIEDRIIDDIVRNYLAGKII